MMDALFAYMLCGLFKCLGYLPTEAKVVLFGGATPEMGKAVIVMILLVLIAVWIKIYRMRD